MKILVTGGAGYIGSHVVLELLRQSHEVIVVDNLEKGNELNVHPSTKFIRGNIQDEKVLEESFQYKPDAVFHFAAWKGAGESMEIPGIYSLNNINGTLKLLTKMAEKNTRYFIFSSSAAVYGSPKYLPITEDHPKNPENYYGYTKLCIEENLAWYDKLKGIRYAALRYFNAAGYDPEGRIKGIEKTPANLLPVIMENANGKRKLLDIFGTDYETEDGTCVRDYIHVTDLVDAHIRSLDYLSSKNQSLAVNLSTEKGHSVLEMHKMAEEVTGRKIPIRHADRRPGDPAKLYASSKKANELLGWTPKFSDPKTIISTMWNLYKDQKY